MSELHLTDILGTTVTATATALGIDIQYMFGDVQEVVTKLSIMSKESTTVKKKYPLIALFTDIPETRGERTDVQSRVVIPTLIIATFTSKNYHANERMEKSIKAKLQPIYDEFMKQIELNEDFLVLSEMLIKHTKINRLSWGQSAIFTVNNLGSDFIDAIEIQNLELMIKRKIC